MHISRADVKKNEPVLGNLASGEVFEVTSAAGQIYVKVEMDASVHINKIGGNPNISWCWVMNAKTGKITTMDALTPVYTPHAKLVIGT